MKAMWVLLVVCVSLLAVHCDNGDVCGGYESDYEALVAGAKACSLDTDCQLLQVRCEMVGNCGEHVNHSLEAAELNSLTTAWMDDGCQGGAGISCCDGGVPPAEAVCIQGECGPKSDLAELCNEEGPASCEDVFACEEDSDCVKVPGECCPCNQGGISTAINVCCIEAHEALLGCGPTRGLCEFVILCNDLVPACEDGQCALVEPGIDQ